MRNLSAAVEAVKNSQRFGYYDVVEIHLPFGPGDILPRVFYVSTAEIEVAPAMDFNDFIYRSFKAIWDRPPTSAERSDWLDALLTASAVSLAELIETAADLIDALLADATYTDRMHNDEQFVETLYASYLGRFGGAGAAGWVADVVANGRAHTQAAFRESIEFSSRMSLIVLPTAYTNDVREPADIVFSEGVSIDGVSFSLTNADNAYGDILGQAGRRLYPCPAVVKRAFELPNGTYEAVVMVVGFAQFGDIDADNVNVSITSDTTPDGTDVAEEVTQHCTNVYKRAGCDSADGSATCSHIKFDTTNGCITKAAAPQLVDIAPPNNLPSFKGIAQPLPSVTSTVGVGLEPAQVGPSGWPISTYDPYEPRFSGARRVGFLGF